MESHLDLESVKFILYSVTRNHQLKSTMIELRKERKIRKSKCERCRWILIGSSSILISGRISTSTIPFPVTFSGLFPGHVVYTY